MADSLAEWLSLREPADAAARSATLTRAIVDAVAHHSDLKLLDLGTGTASNLRFLAGHLPARQHWLLVDRDPLLLAEAVERTSEWAMTRGCESTAIGDAFLIRGPRLDCWIERRCLDLGRLGTDGIFAGRHLVTASALLDLVSESWLRALAACCRESGAAALFALTYNGRSHCSPPEPEDDAIRELMNRHQRANDKGFGSAAGSDAVECADRCFTALGYHVRRDSSDWVLSPSMQVLQRQLIEGWAEAALEIAPDQAVTINSWLARRLAHVDGSRSHVIVCHEDLAAWVPPE
jgi:hypothetical protein